MFYVYAAADLRNLIFSCGTYSVPLSYMNVTFDT